MPTENEINFLELSITLIGGVAVFLTGMTMMTKALKKAASQQFQKLQSVMLRNRFTGIASGTVATGVTQSSTVTTVLLVGFVSAGLMSLQQSIGVIMGANIGSTFTAQIIAFKVQKWALAFVAIGMFSSTICKTRKGKNYSYSIQGLGFIFLGMNLMSLATEPLRTHQPFINFMGQMDVPLLGLLAGTIITAILNSSAATTALLVSLASQNLVSLEAGISLALGANIGTCFTAMIATFGKPREAMQVASVHILFNIIGVICVFPFLKEFTELVIHISPQHLDLENAARLSKETPRQIANAHTLFNVLTTLALISFTSPLAKIVRLLFPPREEEKQLESQHLHSMYLDEPSLALKKVKLELIVMAEHLRTTLEESTFFLTASEAQNKKFKQLLLKKDDLFAECISYLRKIAQQDLSEQESQRLQSLTKTATILNNMIDLVAINWLYLAKVRAAKELTISSETHLKLQAFYQFLIKSLDKTIKCIHSQDKKDAEKVYKMKDTAHRSLDHIHEHLLKRLSGSEPNRVELYHLQSELSTLYWRFYDSCRRIAKAVKLQSNMLQERQEQDSSLEETELTLSQHYSKNQHDNKNETQSP